MTVRQDSSSSGKTPLNALHQELGAKMVPFAGYEMPLNYPRGIIHEHTHTRSAAGLFDISHMGQIRIVGDAAAAELEALVPSSLTDLSMDRQRYTVLTLSNGGILDDLVITNGGGHLFLVVNAARKEDDLAHLRAHLTDRCPITELSDRALLALQGPKAVTAMTRLVPGTETMPFLSARVVEIERIECFLTRSGYTGEDGFELSVPAPQAERLARLLLSQPEVEAAGLGARDSLRLEAGLCLYGHDIDETTTPVEAGLGWVIAPAYRQGRQPGRFPGAEIILEQVFSGAPRRRVGLRPEGRAPVREGTTLLNRRDEIIGRVTSGGFGPTIGAPVAMGYVDAEYAGEGSELITQLRGRAYPVRVASLPFVEHRYFRGNSG
jgi:glycine cleavage system T protein (aminomethyltransferase)